MKSETVTVHQIFQVNRQYRVPFYQRNYVWNKEEQWERLWADIEDKADERLLEVQPIPHFLGAVVLEPQPRQGILGIEEVYIIDGQQRLTTLQYIFAALAIILRSAGENALLSLISGCQWNSNPETMKNKEVEIFKLRPTFRDQKAYELAVSSENLNTLQSSTKFFNDLSKETKRLSKKANNSCPSAIEAVRYFHDQITFWMTKEKSSLPQSKILSAITEAVLCDFKIVSIILGEEDDAQVIFETLNGHGAQLHATDLIRNFIFMRADREGNDPIDLYNNLWVLFEDKFWTEEQTRGRLKRHRLEWFVQTILQAEFREEVDISKLYLGYRRFSARKSSYEQLCILTDYAEQYKQLISGEGNTPISRFGRRIKAWDSSTTHSLALLISKSDATDQEKNQMFDYIVSYFVRRAVCGLTMKNYNRVFNQQIKKVSKNKITPESLYNDLSSLEGKAVRWPRDDEFQKSWTEAELYRGNLDASKIKAILLELETNMRSIRSEESNQIDQEYLDVEHILPINWFEYWPLPDGTSAKPDEINKLSLYDKDQNILSRMSMIANRERLKNTIGNLTLLNYGLNRGLKNFSFSEKRKALFNESNLHLNRTLMVSEYWGENDIEQRSNELFRLAEKIWKGPMGLSETSWLIEAMMQPKQINQESLDLELGIDPCCSTLTNYDSWIVKNISFPVGTEFRAIYKRMVYMGSVIKGALLLEDGEKFSSPSAAARHITSTEVNGWDFWECRFPGEVVWKPIGKLREKGLSSKFS